ncbi:MAG TPA: hypothetical protein VGW38_17040 [Chloroflexota bacterium]|nr:hypothetical protein [Chloroflexota bacterium]
MHDFLDQIEIASGDARLYYLALAGALLVPDICGALEAPNGEATANSYQQWFDANYAQIMLGGSSPLTAHDCWRFRCSFLHQGRTQHPQSGYTRIMFIEPGGPYPIMHMCSSTTMNNESALQIDVRLFCMEMVAVARRWLADVQGTEPFETNLQLFVRRHPNGIAPYIVGVPIIS